MNRLIRRLVDISARHPWRTIGTWAVVAALLVGLTGALGGKLVDDFSAPGSESADAMELLEARFPAVAGGGALAVFAVEEGQQLNGARPVISAALAQLADREHVIDVSAVRLAPDGRIGFAEITLDVPSTELGTGPFAELVETLEPVRDDGVTAVIGGEAAFLNDEEPKGSEAIGLLAALVILLVAFGTVVAALVPIAIALTSVGIGLAGILLLAGSTDVSTGAIAVGGFVGLGVGIDYALFIVSRYRDNRTAGQPNAVALSSAMATSGTAVFIAGATVVFALAALLLTGVTFLASIGVATAIIVMLAVGSALTLLPALLTLLGDRIDAGRVPGRRRAPKPVEATASWRLAHRISARPWPYLVVGSLLMLTLAAPALSLKIGWPDASGSPAGSGERQAYDLLADGFGPGVNGPLVVVADLADTGFDAADLPALEARIAADPGIADVDDPRLSPSGDTAVLSVLPITGPSDAATLQTLERIRSLAPDGVHVTGTTALTLDLNEQLTDTLPLFVGAILGASFLLLMLVFRSIVIPIKAVLMNLLSIGAAYGAIVAVFQWGWLAGLFGVDGTYRIASPLPAILFAVLFGLSMDYEVFMVSRIREAFTATGDNAEAVARGLSSTARVITSAALIMIVVFLSLIANPSPDQKMIGLGLAVAIAVDATIVRMVLVPATLALMGRANWWLPGWLDRLLPHLDLEGEATGQAPARLPVQRPTPVEPVRR
jgi:RND superfamily putative drug exporter